MHVPGHQATSRKERHRFPEDVTLSQFSIVYVTLSQFSLPTAQALGTTLWQWWVKRGFQQGSTELRVEESARSELEHAETTCILLFVYLFFRRSRNSFFLGVRLVCRGLIRLCYLVPCISMVHVAPCMAGQFPSKKKKGMAANPACIGSGSVWRAATPPLDGPPGA